MNIFEEHVNGHVQYAGFGALMGEQGTEEIHILATHCTVWLTKFRD